MWNDGPAKQPWLNYFNEYELQHCCFGSDGDNDDNGNNTQTARDRDDAELGQITGEKAGPSMGQGIQGDPQGYGEDTGLTADQAAEAMAAADAAAAAAAAAGANPEAQASAGQAAADMASADLSGQAIGDIDGGIGLSMEEIDKLEDLGLIGYNERQDLGYFDKLDRSIDISNQRDAAALNKELAAKDLDAQVAVDKFGNYTYTGPDKYSALAGEIGKAAMELSPTIQLGKTIDELGGISGLFGKAKDGLVSAFSGNPSTSQTLSRLAGSDKDLSGLAGIGEFSPSAAQTAIALGTSPAQTAVTTLDPSDIGMAWSREQGRDLAPDDLSYAFAAQPGRDLAPDDIGMAYSKEPGRDLAPDDIGMAYSKEPGRDLDPSDLSYAFAAEPSKAYSLGKYSLGPKTETEADRRRDVIEKVKAEIKEENRRKENLAAIEDMLKYRSAGGMVYRKLGGGVKEKRKSAIDKFFAKVSAPSAYSQEPTPMYSSYVTALPPEVITEDLFSTVARERREAAGETPVFNYDRSEPYSKKLYAASYGLDPATIENVMPTLSSTNPMLDALRKNLQERRDKEKEEEEETTDPIVEDDDNYSMYDEEAEDFGGIGSIGDDVDTTDQELTDDWNDDPDAMFAGGGGIRDVLYRQTGGAANPNEYAYIGGVPGWADQFRRRRPPEPIMPPLPEPPPPPPEPKIIYDPVREAEAEKRARELQAIRVGELGTAPQTRAEREALQASGGFYRDEEGQVRDAQGNLQEDFGFDYVAPPPPDPYDPPNTPDTPPPVVPDDPTDPLPGDPVMPDPFPPPPDDKVYPMPFPTPPIYNPIRPLPGPDNPIALPYFPDLGRPSIYQPMIEPQLQPTGLQGLQQNMQGFGMQSPVPFGTQQPFSSGFGGFGQQQGYNR